MATNQRELLKAQALGEKARSEQLSDTLSGDERRGYFLLCMALFAIALEHRLGENPDRAEIDMLMREIRYDYRDAGDRVNFLHIEAMIRGIFGEDHLLEDVSPESQYNAQMPVIYKIVAQSDAMKSHLDKFLDDAEKLVQLWLTDKD